MIDVAIVCPTSPPTRAGEPGQSRTGSIWTRRNGKVRRRTIECITAAGIKLEVSAYLERLLGKNVRIQVIQPVYADATVAPALTALVAAPVHDAPHGYSHFLKIKHVKEGFTPFDYGFAGQVHVHFRPSWYVEPEAPILLKSSAGDHFTYPATDDTDDLDSLEERNKK